MEDALKTAGRTEPRRVAMLEPALGCGINRSGVAPRRRIVCLAAVRGLKPTATIVVSLCETGRKCPYSKGGCPACHRGRHLAARNGTSDAGTGGDGRTTSRLAR